jgi:chromosome segregation ATPase
MDKKQFRQIKASLTKIQRQVSSAQESLKSVRNEMGIFRQWMTDMQATNASMVHRIQEANKKNATYKAAIRRFYHAPIINAEALNTVRRVNDEMRLHEMHLMECQMSKEGIEHFNLAKPIKPGDLFPYYFYKATAIIHRKN